MLDTHPGARKTQVLLLREKMVQLHEGFDNALRQPRLTLKSQKGFFSRLSNLIEDQRIEYLQVFKKNLSRAN